MPRTEPEARTSVVTVVAAALRARSLARRPWHRTLVVACETPRREPAAAPAPAPRARGRLA